MDAIENAISLLGFQATAIAERVPNDERTTKLLHDAADERELFDEWREVMREFLARGVIGSTNRPLAGDYGEHLVAKAFDAVRPKGRDIGVDLLRGQDRLQVKARRDRDDGKPATHFDVTNLSDSTPRFDYLIGIRFDRDFNVAEAWQVAHEALAPPFTKEPGKRNRVRLDAIRAAVSAATPGVQEIRERIRVEQ